jgi:hypothetical protein
MEDGVGFANADARLARASSASLSLGEARDAFRGAERRRDGAREEGERRGRARGRGRWDEPEAELEAAAFRLTQALERRDDDDEGRRTQGG